MGYETLELFALHAAVAAVLSAIMGVGPGLLQLVKDWKGYKHKSKREKIEVICLTLMVPLSLALLAFVTGHLVRILREI